MEKILQVKNLHTSFSTRNGEVKAIRGVSFHVNRGEALGIVGESGSGKSVTSLSILKLLAPGGKITDGEIVFDGIDLVSASLADMRKIRGAKISMIFQDPMSSLNPLITIGKQVEEMLSIHMNMSKDKMKKRVIELLELVSIPEPSKRYNSYPHEFSGGMRQRVIIAMALACNPSLIIADEPTTALDVTIQDQILKLLRSLQSEMNMSIMFITHDLGVVAEMCSRMLVMYGGMIMEEGSVEDLFANPAHPYTMGLLKSIPGIAHDKDKKLTSIPGSPPNITNMPDGCPFHPRCSHARFICSQKAPPYIKVGEQHFTRCWLLEDNAPKEDNPFRK